jgi:hypothetical protein
MVEVYFAQLVSSAIFCFKIVLDSPSKSPTAPRIDVSHMPMSHSFSTLSSDEEKGADQHFHRRGVSGKALTLTSQTLANLKSGE